METEDIINGLKHMADDHKCCKAITEEAVRLIERLNSKDESEDRADVLSVIIKDLESIVRHWSYDTKWDYEPIEDSDLSCREKMNSVLSDLMLMNIKARLA